MPYKRVGTKVYSKASGKWKLKQTCDSADNAEAAMRLLRGLESGSIKQEDVGKKRLHNDAWWKRMKTETVPLK